MRPWTTAKKEFAVLLSLLVVYVAFLLPALFTERTHVRDDLRKEDLGNIKRALEMYNNEMTYYATPPDSQQGCTSSEDHQSWFFGSDSPLSLTTPHDVRATQGHEYVYCVTSLDKGKTNGFYLQAQLERRVPEAIGYDEDERRQYSFRILHDGDKTFFRVCGGAEMQCGAPHSS